MKTQLPRSHEQLEQTLINKEYTALNTIIYFYERLQFYMAMYMLRSVKMT